MTPNPHQEEHHRKLDQWAAEKEHWKRMERNRIRARIEKTIEKMYPAGCSVDKKRIVDRVMQQWEPVIEEKASLYYGNGKQQRLGIIEA